MEVTSIFKTKYVPPVQLSLIQLIRQPLVVIVYVQQTIIGITEHVLLVQRQDV